MKKDYEPNFTSIPTEDLSLYEYVTNQDDIDKFGWEKDGYFLLWIPSLNVKTLKRITTELAEVCASSPFDDISRLDFALRLGKGKTYINLCEVLSENRLERVFPKHQYSY